MNAFDHLINILTIISYFLFLTGNLGTYMKSFASYFVNRHKQQDLINLLGATYAAVLFLGATNASAVQSVVAVERTVFYRERAAGMYSELPYAFAQVRDWKLF
jgi:hypothetical protein